MQCASLNQTPGPLARGANIKRAHTRTSLLRPCAALDTHVQITPQSRAEERKTYLGSVSPAYKQSPFGFGAYLR